MFRIRKRYAAVMSFMAVLVILAGCVTDHKNSVALSEGPYILDSGDRLRVVVFGQDSLSNSYTVDAGGKISMPLIGAVPARGMTTAQLEKTISSKLQGGYIRDPQVAVEVATYRPFFILGEVNQAGQFPYVAGMTVQSAIAIAGGFTARARKDEVEISRNVNGSLVKAVGSMTSQIQPGDTIVVQERWF